MDHNSLLYKYVARTVLAGGLALATTSIAAAELALTTVEEVPSQRQVTAYGVVHPEMGAVLSAKVLARVMEMPLRAGDPVAKGQTVVALDKSDLEAEMAVAKAASGRAQAALKQAKSEYSRVKSLAKRGSATARELDQATGAYQQAQQAASGAESQLALVATRIGHTTINAPFSGRLVERLTEVGQMAAPGAPLVRLESAGAPELWADISQHDIGRVAVGAAVQVEIGGLSAALSGKVTRIVPAGDPRSHTFTVKVRLDGDTDTLAQVRSGMFGVVAIPYATDPVLMVPESAVVRRSEVTAVYVMGDHQPELRLVRLGRMVGDQQVILSGLSVGESVVTEAAQAARLRGAAASSHEAGQ